MKFSENTTAAGLRVLVEENPRVHSTAAGFFVHTGSRDETPEVEGVSHFLEHMSFKSTKKRSALDVSRVLDEMGSQANAYTSWERTVYYAQVLPEFTHRTIELLAEMIDPGFVPEDFTTEKNVILEEIEMYNDRPEFLLFESLMEKRFEGHPLAGRILGTRESITDLTLEQMKAYHAARYRLSNLVLAVAGKVDAEEVFRWAEELPTIGGLGPVGAWKPVEDSGRGHAHTVRTQDQQEHYIAAWPGPRTPDLRGRYVAAILGVLLGDEEGSRLSWALSHPGIAESVSAGSLSFRDTGLLYASFSCVPENYEQARELLLNEVRRLRADVPATDELERARTKFAARTTLGSESTMGRMSGLGSDAVDGVSYHSLETELRIILEITRDEVMEMIDAMGDPEITAAIGPVAGDGPVAGGTSS